MAVTDPVVWLSPDVFTDVGGGQYRTVKDDSDPRDGKLVQWVDDAPEDPVGGDGHFELYKGKAEAYTPRKEAQP